MKKTIAALALLLAAFGTFAAQVRTRGVATAPIVLEVFSDFQCPGCKALYENTLRPLMADYADKGKVYVIHREYPLPIHAHAMEAACYACAASHVGKYEQACDALFRQQAVWSSNGKVDEVVCGILTP